MRCVMLQFYSLSSDSVSASVSAGDRLSEIFLFLTFFWTMEVVRNVLSVTISGVVSCWYYYSAQDPAKKNEKMPLVPTATALRWALTTSFGSVCLGTRRILSLLFSMCFFLTVSLLQRLADCGRSQNLRVLLQKSQNHRTEVVEGAFVVHCPVSSLDPRMCPASLC